MGDSTENTSFARLVIESIPKPEPRPPKLHHYTSFNTAKEILLSNTLHLSHAAFSNDPTELGHGPRRHEENGQTVGAREIRH